MRLTEKDNQGNWCVKGLPWKNLYVGTPITEETRELLYGALCKLKDYEDTELSPDEVEKVNDFVKSQIAHLLKKYQEEKKKHEWIPCNERMPEEHDSIFKKWKGTDKWNNAMFEKDSDDVNVTVEFEDGTRKTRTAHTLDGKWDIEKWYPKKKVIAWQPLPEPYKE